MTAVRRTDLTGQRLGNLDAVARILGVTKDFLYRNRKALAAEHGFPEPVPGMGPLYDLEAIHLWLDHQLPAAPRPGEGAAHAGPSRDPASVTSLLEDRTASLSAVSK